MMNQKLFILLIFLIYTAALTAQQSDSIAAAELSLEIDGLIIDDTTTKLGKDFYDIFYTNWQPPFQVENYSVTISEKPLPRLGTQVTITINETTMFQSFLQPRYDVIEGTAFQAIAMAHEFLVNFDAIQKQLQGEDLQGSGIF